MTSNDSNEILSRLADRLHDAAILAARRDDEEALAEIREDLLDIGRQMDAN